ncbi:translation initiation factor IF-2 [Acrasis kona]|uniref:Translation initiation factor IF-2 n=1 Tax=Acrasis kona TaxID=1008807 RepID=A0AAW2Z114_9EUKA
MKSALLLLLFCLTLIHSQITPPPAVAAPQPTPTPTNPVPTPTTDPYEIIQPQKTFEYRPSGLAEEVQVSAKCLGGACSVGVFSMLEYRDFTADSTKTQLQTIDENTTWTYTTTNFFRLSANDFIFVFRNPNVVPISLFLTKREITSPPYSVSTLTMFMFFMIVVAFASLLLLALCYYGGRDTRSRDGYLHQRLNDQDLDERYTHVQQP